VQTASPTCQLAETIVGMLGRLSASSDAENGRRCSATAPRSASSQACRLGCDTYTELEHHLEFMTDFGLQVEVVVDQLRLQTGVICNEGVVPGHAVVQMCDALLQILHLPQHQIMPAGYGVPWLVDSISNNKKTLQLCLDKHVCRCRHCSCSGQFCPAGSPHANDANDCRGSGPQLASQSDNVEPDVNQLVN